MLHMFIPVILTLLFCFQTDTVDTSEVSGRKKSAKDDNELKRLEKRASDVDDENLAWLKKLIEAHGFPKSSEIGKKSADEFYLLVVHADRDREFQKDCLERMKEMPQQWPRGYVSALERRASFPSSRIWNARKADSKKTELEKTEPEKTIGLSETQFLQEPTPDIKIDVSKFTETP